MDISRLFCSYDDKGRFKTNLDLKKLTISRRDTIGYTWYTSGVRKERLHRRKYLNNKTSWVIYRKDGHSSNHYHDHEFNTIIGISYGHFHPGIPSGFGTCFLHFLHLHFDRWLVALTPSFLHVSPNPICSAAHSAIRKRAYGVTDGSSRAYGRRVASARTRFGRSLLRRCSAKCKCTDSVTGRWN